MDKAATLATARFDPAALLAGFSGTLVIDEVQGAPELYLALKETVDQERRPVPFFADQFGQCAVVAAAGRIAGRIVGRIAGWTHGNRDALAFFVRRIGRPTRNVD